MRNIINKICCWCREYPSDEPCCWCNDNDDYENDQKGINKMDTYHVGITMHNSFHIDASSPEEAQQKVRDMESVDLLLDVDFNITYTYIDNSYFYKGEDNG